METITCIFTAVIALLLIYVIIWIKTTPKSLPPGPKGWPIFGSYFEMVPTTWRAIYEMGQRYGDVLTVYIGRQRYIVFTTHRAIKEAFINKADNFSGRASTEFAKKHSRGSGIIGVDGALWQEHRRFSLQSLRDLGFGKNETAVVIRTELESLFEHLDKRENQPINANDLLVRTVSNVICTIALGEQPGYDENDDFGVVVEKMRSNIQGNPLTQIPTMFPQSTWLMFLLRQMSSVQKRLDNQEAYHNYIKKKIAKHQETINYDGEPRDFTDVYLQQQHKLNQSGQPHTFTDWQLVRVILELFAAGTDTTSNSLAWGLFWLAIRPEIQEKMILEIEEKIEKNNEITMKDKKELNYTLAVMDEVQRWASIVPTVNHRNFRSDVVCGYAIPANSNILGSIYSTHHDPKIWEKPEEFYPEHFLDEATQLQYRTREQLIPFSLGKRSCLGEILARMEYFIFFVAIVRRYAVSLDPTCRDNLSDVLLGSDGVIRSPGKHKLCFKLRQ